MGEIILTDFFSTKTQANDFSARISNVEANVYEVNFNLEKELEEQLGVQGKDKFMSLLRDNNISLESNKQIGKFFEEIQKTISSLPTVDLTIAIEPSEKFLREISDWFVLNIKKQVILEIEINPDVIAGAIVGYEGERLNSSIKEEFDKVCANVLTNNQGQQS